MDVGHLDGALSNLVPSDVGRWVSDARNLMRQLLQVWALEGVEPRAATIVHHQKKAQTKCGHHSREEGFGRAVVVFFLSSPFVVV